MTDREVVISALPGIASMALRAALISLLALPAAAAPLAPSSELQDATAPSVELVQYRRGGRGYRGVGPGIGLGIAGALSILPKRRLLRLSRLCRLSRLSPRCALPHGRCGGLLYAAFSLVRPHVGDLSRL
jgi:hypothetical protein